MSDYVAETEHRVAPLELFFDLVFVFAFTEVTTLLLEDVSWGGLARGVLVVALVWWAWSSYAWLTNALDASSGVVVTTVLAATAAMLVAALAVPDAFSRERYVFSVAYLIVIVIFVGLVGLAGRTEPDRRAAALRTARTTLPSSALILVAPFVPFTARPIVWLAVLLVGFVGPGIGGLSGWNVHPAHFAERHALIVIIAIGESLAAIGFGARTTNLSAGVIVAAVLGLGVAGSFWLAYFDYVSAAAQQLLAERRGRQRFALARDLYTYLHLLMVVGIVLFAFAMRVILLDVGAKLHAIPALALCGGSALYMLSYVAIRWRISRTFGRGRPIATVAFALLLPVALNAPAIAALALVTTVWLALHAYELIWWREERARRRAVPA